MSKATKFTLYILLLIISMCVILLGNVIAMNADMTVNATLHYVLIQNLIGMPFVFVGGIGLGFSISRLNTLYIG
jgi:hypothetical protein